MDIAERDTGLSDWGPDDFREGLQLFLRSANSEAKLGLVGRVMARGATLNSLRMRLRQVEEAKRHPEALDKPVRRPIVIASCPRTGSTLMLRLLASHPDALSLPLWLGLEPMPAPSAREWGRRGSPERRARADRTTRQTDAFVPHIKSIHEVGTDLQVECTYLMGPSFRCEKWWTNWPTYGYADWMAYGDMTPGYQWYADALKLIQRDLPGSHWILKAPMHFRCIKLLYETLDNALIVHLHRDPAKVIPSINSLLSVTHDLTSIENDAEHRLRTLMDIFSTGAKEMMALRETADASRFMDLPYSEVAGDPIATAKKICEKAQMRWDDEVEAALETYLAANRAGKHGLHKYSPRDCGLSAEQIREAFADYIEHYGVEIGR